MQPQLAIGPISNDNNSAIQVFENQESGSSVGLISVAVDPNQLDTVSYTLTDDAGGLFGIDTDTGLVTTMASLDYDAPGGESHDITVLATSTDGSSSEETFTISVLNDVSDDGVDFGIKPSFGHEKKGFMDKLQSVKLKDKSEGSEFSMSRWLIP